MSENNNTPQKIEEDKDKKSLRELIPATASAIGSRIQSLFSLHLDTDEAGTVDNITKSIEFRGGNLWALIFACLIASIGLNNNSVAVVIGAMLISPLMGPIVGVGYSVATYDFEKLKYSFRNLLLSVVISVLAAALYFFLSPLKEATPELLARTRPSLYDVLIAIFGGAIGIVASSRKDRGNAVPGVAIATALMPPLCTVGYGLATLKFQFFLGALYLFFINSVFIALTAMIVVRYLGFKKHQFIDPAREKRLKFFIGTLVFFTVIPSAYTAYQVVQEAVFVSRAKTFISDKFESDYFKRGHTNTTIVKSKVSYHRDTSTIFVSLVGDQLSEAEHLALQGDLKNYQLYETKLLIQESGDYRKLIGDIQSNSGGGLDAEFVEKIVQEKNTTIEQLNDEVNILRGQIEAYQAGTDSQTSRIAKIVSVIFPEVEEYSYNEVVRNIPVEIDSLPGEIQIRKDTIPTVLVKWEDDDMGSRDRARLVKLLEIELNKDNLELITY